MSSETITRNDLTNILNEVIPTVGVNYVVETHIEPLTIATNAYVETTFTATKSGYFPLGIVGYRIGWVSGETGKCNVYSLEMTDKSEGSVTVTYAVHNVTSASVSMNLRVDILWAKVDGASASFQADYIVEQGTDGIWTYRKWNNGSYDAVYVGTVNMQAGSAMGGGYFHQTSSALTPPSFSQTVKSLHGAANSAVLFSYIGHANDYSTYWWNASSTAVSNVSVRLEMHGTWK